VNNNIFYLGRTPFCYDWHHLLSSYIKLVCIKDIVLEIGCSNLDKTKQLSAYCHQLIGLEKDKLSMPKKSEYENLNINEINGDWHNLTKIFKNRKFDLVVASHVIEHVENDLDCLNQTFSVIKNGGYFIFTTPNKCRLFERLRRVFKGTRKFPYREHKREYCENDIKKLISTSKFCKSCTSIEGLVFGIHAGPLYVYFKHAPKFLRQWTNFWEVVIQKT